MFSEVRLLCASCEEAPMNRPRLTKRIVDAAAPAEKEVFLWDGELSGFGLRLWPSGRRAFIAQFRVGGGRGGKGRRFTIGTYPTLTVDEARSRAREILAMAQLGTDATLEKAAARAAQTVADLTDVWLAEAAHLNRRTGALRSARSVDGERGRINAHIRPLLGAHRLTELTRADIERFRDSVARGSTRREEVTKLRGRARVRGGAGTATRTVRLLSSILAFAVDRKMIAENPTRGVRLAPGRTMNRFLSPEELGRLGRALADLEAEGSGGAGVMIIRLLALTGARRSEIASLRWTEVDLHRSMLRLEESKTGAKIILLAPPAQVLLSEINALSGSLYVFPARSGGGHFQGVGKVWSEAKERASLEGVRLHDLRHTFASFGASGNFGLPVIGALLGHRQAATTQRYAHLADDPVRLAAGKIAGEIDTALSARSVRPGAA